MNDDWVDGLAKHILAHPDDVAKINGRTLPTGLTIVESKLIDTGSYYVISPAAFALPDLTPSDPYTYEFDNLSWKLRYEFGIGMATSSGYSWERQRDREQVLYERFAPSVTWN